MLFKKGPFLLATARPEKKSKDMFVGTASKATITQRTRNMNAKTKGNSTVQQTVRSNK